MWFDLVGIVVFCSDFCGVIIDIDNYIVDYFFLGFIFICTIVVVIYVLFVGFLYVLRVFGVVESSLSFRLCVV